RKFGEYLLHQVVLTHGNAAAEQKQIGLEPFLNQLAQRSDIVAGYGQRQWLAARSQHLRSKREAVGVSNLVGTGVRGDVDQFISGGKNGYPRSLEDFQCRLAYAGGHGDGGVINSASCWKELLAGFGFGAAWHHVLTRRDWPLHQHR